MSSPLSSPPSSEIESQHGQISCRRSPSVPVDGPSACSTAADSLQSLEADHKIVETSILPTNDCILVSYNGKALPATRSPIKSRPSNRSSTMTVGLTTSLSAMDTDEPTRRNPKRKVSEVAAELSHSEKQSVDLLKEALAPVEEEDIRQWTGWCELESEPAFFNILLSRYGAKNVKIQEVFSIDDEILSMLPQPVHGLIFLYQYFSEEYDVDEEADDKGVWFANQTTDNACATLALMNIIMNSPAIELGSELRAFKNETDSLSFPLRGRALDTNEHIRTIHNCLTRRMDHLNADLWVGNKAEKFRKNKKRKSPAVNNGNNSTNATNEKKQDSRTPRKKKLKVDSDSGFHFIALVPANGFLWELDGLKPGPVNLGPVAEGDDFVSVAKPFIQARMLQFEEGAVYFNMMALCRSPLAAASEILATTIRQIEMLHTRADADEAFAELIKGVERPLTAEDESRLEHYGIAKESLAHTEVAASFEAKIKDPACRPEELQALYHELATAQKVAMGEYRDEQAALQVDELRVQGRKKDNMAMIHRWLEIIAEHEELEKMMAEDDA